MSRLELLCASPQSDQSFSFLPEETGPLATHKGPIKESDQIADVQADLSLRWVHMPTYIFCWTSGPEVIKLFPCSTQLSMKFTLLIKFNVKMPFISMINTLSERLKARNFFICRYFRFYEQLKFHAQFS